MKNSLFEMEIKKTDDTLVKLTAYLGSKGYIIEQVDISKFGDEKFSFHEETAVPRKHLDVQKTFCKIANQYLLDGFCIMSSSSPLEFINNKPSDFKSLHTPSISIKKDEIESYLINEDYMAFSYDRKLNKVFLCFDHSESYAVTATNVNGEPIILEPAVIKELCSLSYLLGNQRIIIEARICSSGEVLLTDLLLYGCALKHMETNDRINLLKSLIYTSSDKISLITLSKNESNKRKLMRECLQNGNSFALIHKNFKTPEISVFLKQDIKLMVMDINLTNKAISLGAYINGVPICIVNAERPNYIINPLEVVTVSYSEIKGITLTNPVIVSPSSPSSELELSPVVAKKMGYVLNPFLVVHNETDIPVNVGIFDVLVGTQ